MKKVIASIMVIAMAAISACAISASAATVNNNEPVQLGTGYSNYRSNTAVYQVLYNTIRNSSAKGYTVCKLAGSDSYHLVLSYGSCEADRHYDFYKIGKNDVTFVGVLGGCHTTLYIDAETCKLGIYKAVSGCFSFGTVSADGDLHIDYTTSGRVAPGQAYPSAPGNQISFWGTDNLTGIANF